MQTLFRGFQLQPDDYEWLSKEYPLFEQYYEPYFRKNDNHIFANASPGIPAACTVCQVPAEFPDPDNPTKLWTQYSEYNNKTYMTCSPGCKHIFEQEPFKYMSDVVAFRSLFEWRVW